MTITRCSTDAMKTIHDIPDKCDIQYGPPRSDYDNLYKEIKCIPAQLLDGATPLQGRVEAGLFGQLQSICSLGFDARAANVTCASLGYRRGVTQVWQNSHFGAGLKPIYKRNITCSGDELSLELCNHSNTDIPGCDGSNVVGIECKGDMIKLDPLFGSRPYEGILEGFHDDFRYDVIGSVSNTTAKTLCAMLGHGFVGFAGLAIPSRNLHYYKMDVSCSGTEKSINECKGDLEYCVAQRYWHCMTMSNMHRHVALFCSAGANDTEVLGSLICQENATSLADCHVKHQFSYRPYRVDNACRNYVKLNWWHRRLSLKAADHKCSFYVLVPLLRREAEYLPVQAQLVREGTGRVRRNVYVNLDEQLGQV
ncbi:lysyl oxidase homolog 2-like [Dreissena polymorpha]|uniref:lysyl oxidase homolog 2-like n=1 Tax=Dreissena polymorpha TaxID=45954 RepID=UPI002264E53B|nr:lysyl oxidase homolog 2-like [Dreissena polymorpha]